MDTHGGFILGGSLGCCSYGFCGQPSPFSRSTIHSNRSQEERCLPCKPSVNGSRNQQVLQASELVPPKENGASGDSRMPTHKMRNGREQGHDSGTQGPVRGLSRGGGGGGACTLSEGSDQNQNKTRPKGMLPSLMVLHLCARLLQLKLYT